ncbi:MULTISPECIES: thioredoxin family protein [unclassified Moorena]|uniref:thioredoxin family protein n=1 Tax=unclassified Moorena TaxID=2683338 RepID=UPI0013B94084|nr:MULTISPECIES: thioredoxin family protein [unclassified Moorena]NER86567.1 thioredoxin family protein [Moorena sp. SIO3A2]NES44732.1 thioredoxin family protein [Moorena sp. SIO2C4]NES86920.1 thioredoxin family protein [Moorena sp. SIO2B7]NET65730.1 thioredoxin family protein [Moorena sp. SIO1G6]
MTIEKIIITIGSYAPDFELPGTDEQVHHLCRYLERFSGVGVIFLGNNCPYVNSYIPRLKHIQDEFEHQGFTLVGINANDVYQYPAESFEEMKQFCQDQQLNFPYLWDPTQDVAHSFGAQKTTEAFLIDHKGIVCYNGSIDDNPQDGDAVQAHYLHSAIASLLAGQEISTQSTKVTGSPIQWR